MFQPLLDLIERFINVMERIADALELSAKNSYYKEDIALKEKEAREQKRISEEARRKEILDELISLKIPYASEMSTEQLEKRLNEFREKALEKLKAAESTDLPGVGTAPEPKKAKAPAKPKVEPQTTPAVDSSAVDSSAVEVPAVEVPAVSDEELRAFCVEICQKMGDPWLVNFFAEYAKKNKFAYTRISQLVGIERNQFMSVASASCK